MTTAPGLLGAAVLFWGWQTGLLPAAVPIAFGLEASRLVTWRWELSPADVRRIADLCRLVLVAMAVYLGVTRGTARAVLGLIEWFPLAVLPLVVCQAYGPGDAIDLRTFFLILRRRRAGEEEPAGLAHPYLVVCLAAASAANVRGPAFYAGLSLLAAWALWPARSRAFSWPAWAGALALAAAAGYGGHVALHELQGALEGTIAELVLDYMGRGADPFQSRTAIGSIGRLKLSDRILFRVETGRPPRTPLLLHEASYNVYTASVWGAVDAEFEPVPPQLDRRTWDLGPAPPAPPAAVTVSAYLRRGRGMVLVPGGTFRVEGLLALQMKRNRLGAVKVEEGLGLVTYRTRAAPGRSLGGPPTDLDLKLPAREGPAVTGIARELGLADRPPAQAVATVVRYFASGFGYSTYLDAPRRRTGALEDFLLRTRAGHCEYFATATVLLLRAAGIPARYATGYSVQEWSPREQRYLVRARHGHSWALAYLDGVWRDVDTTPSVWARVEQEAASSWQPLADLASWAWFVFSRWRFSDQDTGYLRYAGWLLVPLFGFLAWRLHGARRVARAAANRPGAAPPASRPGADSEFYLVEARLARLGLGRQPWEPVSRWVARVGTDGLGELAALHARYRFDPRGLSPSERETLRAAAGAWLARGPRGPAMPDPATRPGSRE
jgi:transglutaminase-like putative cysteine protease